MVVALAAVAMVVTVMVSATVFPHGTADLDEVAYQTQANVLRDGHLELAASRQDPSFRPLAREDSDFDPIRAEVSAL